MTGEQIAKTMGKPTSFVSKHLRLIDAPENVTALLRDKVTSDVDLAYTLIQVNENSPEEAEKLVAAARESGISRAQVKAVLDEVKNKGKDKILHAKSKAQNKKPARPVDSNSGVKPWQVVVDIDGQQGTIMTDRAPDAEGYVWVKLEIGEISVEASELRVKGMRSQ